jgi:hypothetical protein
MVTVDLGPGECNGGVTAVLRAGGWVSRPHCCDMISAGSSVLTRGRYASPGAPAADLVRRSRAASGLPGVSADGAAVVRRLRGSPLLALRALGLLPECAGRLAGLGGRP